ncbi:MAG: hypothetical protein Q9226_007948 [Calogaya cf. arnoldii]
MILHYVADIATFTTCLKVSKTFRTICNKRPLVLYDVVLHDAVPPGQTISLLLKEEYSECRNEEYKVDFHATLQSSGQQMNIHIGSGNNQYAYSYAVGSGFNRKSRVGQISFCGLELPAPLKEPIEPETRYRPDYQGEKIDLWDKSLRGYNVPNRGNVKNLAKFGDYYHLNHTHFLFLLIKRGSKFWPTPWDDAKREVKQTLTQVDDSDRLKDRVDDKWVRRVQAVGAANPYVIIAIGLEVRLFEWQQVDGQALDTSKEQSFDGTLTELKPGKVYSLLDREGRKDIDVVIKSASERFDKAPKNKEWQEMQE